MAVTKVINSEEKQFRPVLVDKVVLDAVPTVNSFNSVTSDGVARAIAGASGEVPVVTENDNGKVLKAVYDEGGPAVEWGDAGAAYSAGDGITISDQNAISVTETVRNGAAAGATAVQPGSLATVATTGAYSDLSGTPTIPTTTSQLTNNSGFITLSDVPAQAQSNWNESDTEDPSFIQNKPTIPAVDQTYDATSTNAQSGTAVASAIAAAAPTVDQVYDATSANAQSGTAVAGALAGVNQVPASTSSDASKVLTVDSQGVPGWATPAAPAGGDSDEWWGGDPGRITLPEQTIRLKFKDLTYDPRNETDTSFTDHFQSITKVEDGVYDFLFANVASGSSAGNPRFYAAFKNKYLTDNEFVILAFNFTTATYGKSKDAYGIFEGCTGLRAAYNIQDSNDSQNRNGSFVRAFYGCTGLVYFSVMDRQAGNEDFRISSVSNFSDMFNGCSSLVDCNLVISRVSGTAQCPNMFEGCASLVTGPSIDRGVSNAVDMFSGCKSLRGFHLNNILGVFDIPADTACDCHNMFYGCYSLESSDIPFFLYHTVSSAQYMFNGCKKMTTPPRHIKVTSGVSLNASYMFEKCWVLESLPEMDYGAITTIDYMFQDCVMLPDISPLATVTWNASLTNVTNMFYQCWSIEKGLKDVYDNMAATATITSHSNTFKGCGTAFGNTDLALIPTSWGGGAA